ncbi:MAG TPA: division/cell wall cluster transcriptional repressor MraZ [Anaerolineaceae bacterium]|nr:division/cell wall cluster transcriptional repressor MraZ [Anaerolineales bacterium]HOG58476.1 division/cell wall cluster transcriptional repressor MraZ [Anaerolineaceae bacterium]HOR83270.1 division/cell wall cluster transcriptional repressor MraZ [Anaerolineaceae bacterium]HOT53521.1 division/cell wall cluster transcriptional repressor MraZ [Anaerolineaceae bacterium]HPL43153.1 division/cell wall cluster transcriptional repressor MraZ [Anaerolineaceae bacterium]
MSYRALEKTQRFAIKKELERMFVGQFDHNIDAKGRLTVPSNFREQAPEGFFVTKGFDSNLIAYPRDVYEYMAANINGLSVTDPESRTLRRMFFSNTVALAYDTAGRILLPAFLREAAQITSACKLIGNGDNFEIWSMELWLQENERNASDEMNSSRWAKFNISTRGQ